MYKHFKLRKNVLVHVRGHTSDECGEHFAEKLKLTNWTKLSESATLTNKQTVQHTGEGLLTCDQCGKKFSKNLDLTRHLIEHSEERPFSCDQCGKKFNKKRNLTTHLREHTGDKSFSCDICVKKFTKMTAFTAHMKRHYGVGSVPCDLCGKKFIRNSALKSHMIYHNRGLPFFNDMRENNLRQKRSLISTEDQIKEEPDIINKIIEDKLNPIPISSTDLVKKEELCEMDIIDIKEEEISFENCTIKSNHTVHMRHHTEEQSFSCDQCGKMFTEKRGLTLHMTNHTGDRPFSNICENNFSQKRSLISTEDQIKEEPDITNKIIEDKLNPIPISSTDLVKKEELCEMDIIDIKEEEISFENCTINSNPTVHMRHHTEEQTFSCDQCGKMFTEKRGLTVHMTNHTGDRPFSNDICENNFSQKRSLISTEDQIKEEPDNTNKIIEDKLNRNDLGLIRIEKVNPIPISSIDLVKKEELCEMDIIDIKEEEISF